MSNFKKKFIINDDIEMAELCNKMLNSTITKALDITVSVHRKQRSLAQSQLFHMHMNEVSLQRGETTGEYYTAPVWKLFFKNLFLGEESYGINGKILTETRHTADLKVKEMSEFMECCIAYCATEYNIELTCPQDLFSEAMGLGR